MHARQMLFVSGERLVRDPAGELGRVQDFLGLKRIISDKHFYFNQTKGFPCLKKAEGSGHIHTTLRWGRAPGKPSLAPWEAQSSPRVAREIWGLHSSHCRA